MPFVRYVSCVIVGAANTELGARRMSDRADPLLQQPVRRPYAAPRLTRHGTIAELTSALASGASNGVTGSVAVCSVLPC